MERTRTVDVSAARIASIKCDAVTTRTGYGSFQYLHNNQHWPRTPIAVSRDQFAILLITVEWRRISQAYSNSLPGSQAGMA